MRSSVEAQRFAFLEEHSLIWKHLSCVFAKLASNVLNRRLVRFKREFTAYSFFKVLESRQRRWGIVVSYSCVLWSQLNQLSEECLALRCAEVNFGVGMHAESEWSFRMYVFLDVFDILFVLQSILAAEMTIENTFQIMSGYTYTLICETKVRLLSIHP